MNANTRNPLHLGDDIDLTDFLDTCDLTPAPLPTPRYRVWVRGEISNDGDVKSYVYIGQGPRGTSRAVADKWLAILTEVAGTPAVHNVWIECFTV